VRIVTAREQAEMLSPWRTAMGDFESHETGHVRLPVSEMKGYVHGLVPDVQNKRPEWVDDMKQNGVRRAIDLYHNNGRTHIQDGNHRITMADELGISDVPVNVWNVGDDDENWDQHKSHPVGPALSEYLNKRGI